MRKMIYVDELVNEIQKHKELLQKWLGKDAEFAFVTADSILETINRQCIYDTDEIIRQLENKQIETQKLEIISDYFKGKADGLGLAIATIKGCILADDMLYNDK